MRCLSLLFPALLVSCAVLVSCAKGAQLDSLAGGRGGAGDDGETGGAGTGAAGGGDTGATTTTTTTSDTGGGGTGGAGGSPCDFTASNTCSNAEQLPDVSADEGGTATATGTGSKWLKVHLEETDSSIFASDLSYKVTLTSPPGMDYNLAVKQGPEDGNPDCGAAAIAGTPQGSSETVSNDWNDDQGLGGEDDSRWLSIEITHVSGDDCDAQWSLTVVGSP